MKMKICSFALLTLLTYLSCCVHKGRTESGVCYRDVTRYRIAYRARSGYDTYSCGFLWLGRCRRTVYRRESYTESYTEAERRCCSGYAECTYNSNRCCRDECQSSRTNNCDQICRDTETSYTCSCRSGYRLASNRRSCNDINECAEGTDQCTQICTNTIGSYHCSCEYDYCLASDGLSCIYNGHGFTLKPSSVRVTLGENALFHCQSPRADNIDWKINGIPLHEQSDISTHDIRNEVDRNNIHTLSIAAVRPSYNKTTVKCIATSSDDRCQQGLESPTVNLLIQGKLDAVTDLHTMRGSGDTIIIIWHAPFTLSGANSITYCVDIFDDSGKAITSVCNIRNTQYTFHLKLKKVTIVVTPANQVGRGMERNYTIINNNIHNNNINNNHTTEIASGTSIAAILSIIASVLTIIGCIVWYRNKE